MAKFKKYLCNTLMLLAVATMAARINGQDKFRLQDYQWKNRLILAFSPSPDDPGYRALEKELAIQREEIIDRDILVFYILETGEIKFSQPVSGTSLFKHNNVSISGDPNACPPDVKEMLKKKKLIFPTDTKMILDAGGKLQGVIKEVIWE